MNKVLFDFFPVAVFFITYFLTKGENNNLIPSIISIIIATTIQVAYFYAKNKRVEKIHLITLASVVILGGITIWVDDDLFFKLKPTALYIILTIIFLGSHYIGEKPIIKRFMEKAIDAPDKTWHKISYSWCFFFLSVSAINIYIALNYDNNIWVYFKFLGTLGLTIIFMVIQMLCVKDYIREEVLETNNEENNEENNEKKKSEHSVETSENSISENTETKSNSDTENKS